MTEVDFRKDQYYKAKTEPEIIDIPAMRFVMVDGEGGPESSAGSGSQFQQAMQALFGIIYTIKFWDKKHTTPSNYAKFNLAPVEALWWSKTSDSFDATKPEDWKWTLMLRVPDFVTQDYFEEVVEDCVANKQNEVYKKARLEDFIEGTCVQIMHIGPYSEELPSIEKMHDFAISSGYRLVGKHHELYFGDPRRTAPQKLRTILRQPIHKLK